VKPTVWRDAIRDSELDGTAKHVAHVISTYMNGAGDTFVGKATIAKGASLKSVRAVDYAVKRLEREGLIEIVPSMGGRPNHYLARTPHHDAGSTPHGDAGSTPHLTTSDPASDDSEPRTAVPSTPHGDAPESEVESETEVEVEVEIGSLDHDLDRLNPVSVLDELRAASGEEP
jgi:hypothetical protein